MQQISVNTVAAWAESQRAHRPLILDVREAWELQQARITPPNGADFEHIAMSTLPLRLNELDRTRPIACLCHHGGRSMQVALFLQNQGFTQVSNISGGIDAWSIGVDASVPRY